MQVGDVVERMVGGDDGDKHFMWMTIIGLTHTCIYCVAGARKATEPIKVLLITECETYYQRGMIWKFDRKTGAEIDDDLGWSPARTGTYLKLER